MHELTGGQKARCAVREFKTITDALAIKGEYRQNGKTGHSLERCLLNLSPEIYGSMNDPRVVELNGMEYVIDRLPRGIEECNRVILTEEDPLGNDAFERTEPYKRRRTCYCVGKNEMCFVISRGLSEIYDIVTHLTFLNVEAKKIHGKMKDSTGKTSIEWHELEKAVQNMDRFSAADLDQALWDLSIILGRPYQETRSTYERLEKSKKSFGSNNGLFSLVYHLGRRVEAEQQSWNNALTIYLTPSLMNIIGYHEYEKKWARHIHETLHALNLVERPLHIISANLHSVRNTLYAYAAMGGEAVSGEDPYEFALRARDCGEEIKDFAAKRGFHEIKDESGCHVGCQVIDTALLGPVPFHPEIDMGKSRIKKDGPVIVVIDYAFGAQAFELMENLLEPHVSGETVMRFHFGSVSIMGKAGILPGKKGDIMLPTAHIVEGIGDNYIFDNDLKEEDFEGSDGVFTGPMATVLGTSLQNRHMLTEFEAGWKIIGLEMEGGHYQRAIGAAIIKGNVSKDIKVRYAYYASDNPLETGNTLAAGAMEKEGVKPTYMITQKILTKILGPRD
ncbi:MAG: hypothetical protein GY846_13680 [Deltaproteobacteria bacterium]|nr:hypothetical protein [Deltaproteobacteria bacterium]